MTDLIWLAALLSPRDVAPHPNFRSEDPASAASRLALLVSADFFELARVEDGVEERQGSEWAIVAGAREALSVGTVQVGAAKLEALARDQSLDLAARVAAALVAVIVYAELDDFASVFRVLDAADSAASGSEGNDGQLLRAALSQQRALRIFDAGGYGAEEARQCQSLLAELDPNELLPFVVSPGTARPASQIYGDIVDLLRDASEALLVRLADPNDRSWVGRVRRRPPSLALLSSRRVDQAFTELLRHEFDELVGGAPVRFGRSAPGEDEASGALNAAELAGHLLVYERRAELAMLRFLRPHTGDDAWLLEEAIRLLRQAGDKQRLERLAQHIRFHGPLAPLRADAQKIIEHRLAPVLLRAEELSVLRAAANLLSEDESQKALAAVLSSWDFRVQPRGGSWEDISVRQESVWKTAVALAPSTNAWPDVASTLLTAVERLEQSHELLDMAYARAANAIEWQAVGPDTLDRARSAGTGNSASFIPHTLRAIADALKLDVPGARPDTEIENVATHVDRLLIEGVQVPSSVLQAAVPVVRDALLEVRQRAQRGHFSGGASVSVADLAVALASKAGAPELWPDVAAFLADLRVQREDKSRAFERIARSPFEVPTLVRDELRQVADGLLESPTAFLGRATVPYPAALRCLAALRALDDARLTIECSRLAGRQLPSERAEAAATVAIVASSEPPPEWCIVSALHLAADADAGVRAEAGRCLAILSATAPDSSRYFSQRLIELLDEDGSLVPLLLLRGLAQNRAPLPELLRARVRAVAQGHPDRAVRSEATALLDLGSGRDAPLG